MLNIWLPGVGSFRTAMSNLEPFREVINEHIKDEQNRKILYQFFFKIVQFLVTVN